jgi:hypothetical protein
MVIFCYLYESEVHVALIFPCEPLWRLSSDCCIFIYLCNECISSLKIHKFDSFSSVARFSQSTRQTCSHKVVNRVHFAPTSYAHINVIITQSQQRRTLHDNTKIISIFFNSVYDFYIKNL